MKLVTQSENRFGLGVQAAHGHEPEPQDSTNAPAEQVEHFAEKEQNRHHDLSQEQEVVGLDRFNSFCFLFYRRPRCFVFCVRDARLTS